MGEKKCFNCDNREFCQMYRIFLEMADLFNVNLKPDTAEDTPFIYMVNVLAHDCKRFRALE